MQLIWFASLFIPCLSLGLDEAHQDIRKTGLSNKVLYELGNSLLRLSMAADENTLFTIDYGNGYNLHFETTEL